MLYLKTAEYLAAKRTALSAVGSPQTSVHVLDGQDAPVLDPLQVKYLSLEGDTADTALPRLVPVSHHTEAKLRSGKSRERGLREERRLESSIHVR